MFSAQQRNSEMQALNSADLLSVKDRNLGFFAYNSATSVGFSVGTVSLDTVPINNSPDVYSLSGGILTILQAGIFKFDWRVTVGHASGSANLVAATTLDQDPATGSFAAVPGSLVYWAVLGSAYASGVGSMLVRTKANYRYKIAVSRQSTTDSLLMLANACTLSVERLFRSE